MVHGPLACCDAAQALANITMTVPVIPNVMELDFAFMFDPTFTTDGVELYLHVRGCTVTNGKCPQAAGGPDHNCALPISRLAPSH